jgi:hypothetical protein
LVKDSRKSLTVILSAPFPKGATADKGLFITSLFGCEKAIALNSKNIAINICLFIESPFGSNAT